MVPWMVLGTHHFKNPIFVPSSPNPSSRRPHSMQLGHRCKSMTGFTETFTSSPLCWKSPMAFQSVSLAARTVHGHHPKSRTPRTDVWTSHGNGNVGGEMSYDQEIPRMWQLIWTETNTCNGSFARHFQVLSSVHRRQTLSKTCALSCSVALSRVKAFQPKGATAVAA